MKNENMLHDVTVSMKQDKKKRKPQLKKTALQRGYYVVIDTGGCSNVMVGDVVFKAVTAIWNLRTGENLVLDTNIKYQKPSNVKIKWN